ncbi:hypothetical protein DPMN_055864 [Dreissena polymorpha]|uniref:Uncharacterized protein n=1 Tax=Dreissena polymorpha TaxID=45954 RepID=A0A9D4CS54_DREPO|nr:hypothetical protein DPMN_055864 [Dreissena polymorpha]
MPLIKRLEECLAKYRTGSTGLSVMGHMHSPRNQGTAAVLYHSKRIASGSEVYATVPSLLAGQTFLGSH